MDFIFLLAAILITALGWQDLKSRKIDNRIVAALWFLLFLFGWSQPWRYAVGILSFSLYYFLYLVYPQANKRPVQPRWGMGDVLCYPIMMAFVSINLWCFILGLLVFEVNEKMHKAMFKDKQKGVPLVLYCAIAMWIVFFLFIF